MKTLSIALCALMSLVTTQGFAKNPSDATSQDYLAVQEALASDKLEAAKKASDRLSKSARDRAISKSASKLATAKSIDEARNVFKTLSEAAIEKNKGAFDSNTEVISCSMAKGRWIQKKGEIRNPYYGKSMLSCGERS